MGILIVCLAGLLTRLLPHVWPISPSIQNSRLSYPVTYWNTLGLLAGLGIILCLHLASSRAEARSIRAIVALIVGYHATGLATVHPADRVGVAQGHRVAIVAAVSALVAGLVRLALTRFEPQLLALKLPAPPERARWLVGKARRALL